MIAEFVGAGCVFKLLNKFVQIVKTVNESHHFVNVMPDHLLQRLAAMLREHFGHAPDHLIAADAFHFKRNQVRRVARIVDEVRQERRTFAAMPRHRDWPPVVDERNHFLAVIENLLINFSAFARVQKALAYFGGMVDAGEDTFDIV